MKTNLFEWYKKITSKLKTEDNWKNVSYLQGIIISFSSSIEQLQKENDDLLNHKGIWLSPEKINELKDKLKEIEELLTPSNDG